MDKVLSEIDSRGVARVTINNPDKHNAFDDQIIAELTQTFQTIASDESVRIMVLGSNGKSFSAGADLAWMQRMASYSYDENLRDANALAAMLKTLQHMPQPTIARIQGAAFGGAVGLASCCDMAVASDQATFCLSEVKIGLVPATIAPYVIRAMGDRAARRYFMTAERFDSLTAQRLGLVTEITATDDLDRCIETLITALLGNGPMAVRVAKKLISEVSGKAVDETLIDRTCKTIAAIRVSDEGQEGLNAFLQKRAPKWLS